MRKNLRCAWLACSWDEFEQDTFFQDFPWNCILFKLISWPSQASAGATFGLISFSDAVALQRDRFELNISRSYKVRAIPALGKRYTRLAVLDTVCILIFSLKMLSPFEAFSKLRGTGTSRNRSIKESYEAPRLAASPELHAWNNLRKMRYFSTFANSDQFSTNIQPRQNELRAWMGC